MICSERELALNRFVRYCGIVIESPHTMENERSRGAMKIQLSEYPMNRPTGIHALPMP